MQNQSVIPIIIKKEGITRELFCEVCQNATDHQIFFQKEDKMKGTILFAKCCWVCFRKWSNKVDMASRFEGVQHPGDFFGVIDEHFYLEWNNLITKNL